jgi:trimeric autotransporter adhesin
MKSKLLIVFYISLILSGHIKAQLSGNYTINSAQSTGGTNFQSFTAFADSLNVNGVSGSVTATVAPGSGPYMEQVTFDSIAGTGPSAIITLEGSGETITALTDSADRHVVRLKDIQYFTINNLKIKRDSAATSGFYGIHIYNTGSHITITNCHVDMTGTSSTLVGGYIASGSLTSILATGDFHYLFFQGDTAKGGGYGVSVFGLASPLASNILISNNRFYDFHSNGVYLRETDGAIVRDNHFDKGTPNITSVNAIQVAQNANINTSIYNNFIKVSQTNNGSVTFRGIYLFNGTGHKVYNNVIHDINLVSGNVTGIEIRSPATAPKISFNTISIDNASASTGNLYGIKEELSNTNSVLLNNIISISQPTTGEKAGLVIGATASVTTAFDSDYNDIWTPGGNVAMKNQLTPVFYPALNDWQTASMQDTNSLSLDPMFLSAALPQPTNILMNDAGITIATITVDVLGFARGNPPDVGAYEFPVTVGINSETPASSAAVFPIPFSDVLHIRLQNDETAMLSIYSALSQLIYQQKVNRTALIHTEDFPAGIYLYEMKTNSGAIKTGKLIKN